MHPLGTKVYLLKRYRPSDSFCTFFSESEGLCDSEDWSNDADNAALVTGINYKTTIF